MPTNDIDASANRAIIREANRLKREEKKRKQQQRDEEDRQRAMNLPEIGQRYQFMHCDVARLHERIDRESVDLICTDPPYPRKYLDVFPQLASLAEHALKPGGSLVVMVGQSYLPEVISALTNREGLAYNWTHAYLTPGGQSPQVFPRRVNTFWKPLLWLVKGKYAGRWVGDVVKSAPNDNDKRHHHWGQSESGMIEIVKRFSRPGELILDPFVGGGTTGVAAVLLGRLFIGADEDEGAIARSKIRLAELAATEHDDGEQIDAVPVCVDDDGPDACVVDPLEQLNSLVYRIVTRDQATDPHDTCLQYMIKCFTKALNDVIS